MRSPRLRDTDGTAYDPETGERCAADAGFVNMTWETAECWNSPKYDPISDPPERLASHEAPPGETQAALPPPDETVAALADITATLAAGQRAPLFGLAMRQFCGQEPDFAGWYARNRLDAEFGLDPL